MAESHCVSKVIPNRHAILDRSAKQMFTGSGGHSLSSTDAKRAIKTIFFILIEPMLSHELLSGIIKAAITCRNSLASHRLLLSQNGNVLVK